MNIKMKSMLTFVLFSCLFYATLKSMFVCLFVVVVVFWGGVEKTKSSMKCLYNSCAQRFHFLKSDEQKSRLSLKKLMI